MTFNPVAADFECYVNGELVPWNNEFGLKVRWRAAYLTHETQSKERAAEIVTECVRKQLNDGTVTITVRKT